jgi:GH43 family beta-xylosidase
MQIKIDNQKVYVTMRALVCDQCFCLSLTWRKEEEKKKKEANFTFYQLSIITN